MKHNLFTVSVCFFSILASCVEPPHTVVATPKKVAAKTQSFAYAPSNVGDKTITIKSPYSSMPEIAPYFISDNTTGAMSSAGAKYTKTGNNTAKIEHWDRFGETTLYRLQFTSPHGGKIVGKNLIFSIQ